MDETSPNIVADVRKLRKKLRQIESLERLDRTLNYEENQKVARKGELRLLVQEKLKQIEEYISGTPETSTSASTPEAEQQSPAHTVQQGDRPTSPKPSAPKVDTDAEMKRRSSELDQSEQATSSAGDSHQRGDGPGTSSTKKLKEDVKKISPSSSGNGDAGPSTSRPEASSKQQDASQRSQPKGKSDLQKMREKWAKLGFSAQELEGHNDLISSVDCKENIILSGSRDTTVKAWNRSTGDEMCSLGGHSAAVTSVYLLTAEEKRALAGHYDLDPASCHLALSSSRDCSVRLWDVDSSQELRSIYTFNPVTAMVFLSAELCAVTGSDGGKVELWDLTTGDNIFSSLSHHDCVTCLAVKGQQVVSASSDGVIKVWEVRERSLHVIFESENIRSQSGCLVQRPIISLGLAGGLIFYGDEGTNIKVLDWKRGYVRKLRNHLGDFGTTYSLLLASDVLMFSSYDIDSGVGSLNFFSPDHQYLATVCDSDTSSIEAISSPDPANAAQCFVTAGQELKIWRSVSTNRANAVLATFDQALMQPAEDSDDESSESEASGDEVFPQASPRRSSRRRGSSRSEPPAASSWSSWCSVL